MDEAGDFLIRLKAEAVEDVAVEREPAGQPIGAVAERGGGGDDVHGAGTGRQLLLPRRHLGVRSSEADHADDEGGVGQAALLDLDIGRRRAGIFLGEYARNDVAGAGAGGLPSVLTGCRCG